MIMIVRPFIAEKEEEEGENCEKNLLEVWLMMMMMMTMMVKLALS